MAKTKKGNTGEKGKSSAKKTQKTQKVQKADNRILTAAICIGAGVLLSVFFFIDSEAVLSAFFKSVLLGLFGRIAVIIPFLLVAFGVYILVADDFGKVKQKALFTFLTMVVISAFGHLCEKDVLSIGEAYHSAAQRTVDACYGGGLFGALLAWPMYSLMHRIASCIVLIAAVVALVSLIAECSILSLIYGFIKGIVQFFSDSASKVDKETAYERGRKMSEKVMKRTMPKREEKEVGKAMSTKELLEEMNNNEAAVGRQLKFESDDNEEIVAGDGKIEQIKKRRKAMDEHTKKVKDDVTKNGIDEVFRNMFDQVPTEEKEHMPATENKQMPKNDTSADEIGKPAPLEREEAKREKNLTEVEKEVIYQEIENANEEETEKEYIFPPIELLNDVKSNSMDSRDEMYKTANKLINILDNFGVKAKLLQVTPGPSVTRYEILPNTGVKLSKIVGLADDLALNLAATSVLVAPVPEKAAVGIEIPNKETASVTARELLQTPEFKNSKSKLTVALGKDIGGRVVIGNIAKMPHALIAGATGSGKSVCINTIITSLLYKASPDEVKLIMIDPKVVELGMYNGIPHLLIPVVTDPKKAAGALNWAVTEMMHRYDTFAENFVKNLEGYNHLMEKTGGKKMPQIVIIIDELADLMMVAAKEVEDYICRLAQLARAAGIHLIVATQRPTVDVITGLIKANIPSRIAFAVASQTDSRTIIDRGGADKLLGRGDMLYVPQGARSPLRVQGAYVSDDEIERLVDFLKEEDGDSHYSEDLADHIERVAIGENGVTPDEDDDGDELLPQAIELAVELGQISTSMIQRRLKVGYSRAGRIIDLMEARGVIGGANGSKPRQVYMSHADLVGIPKQEQIEDEE